MVLFTFLLIGVALLANPVLADQGSAQTAISSTQNSLQNCYQAAEQAETAGANITSLMVTFNDAAGLLSQAQLAYSSGDYNAAYNYAVQSQTSLNGFTAQTTTLKDSAVNQGSFNFVVIILSIAGSIAIVCVGIGAYVYLNRKDRRNSDGSPTI